MFGSWPLSNFEQRMFSVMRGAPPTVMVERAFAIRLSYSVPVVRGVATPEQLEATLQMQRDADGVLEEVLLALRLLKPGRVGLRGVVSLIEGQNGEVQARLATRSGQARPLRGERYQLADNDEVALTSFIESFTPPGPIP
jgi:hypothetical protein